MATSAATGTDTKEYQAIKRNYDTIIDNLGSTVGDPGRFVRGLRDKSLISDGEWSYVLPPASIFLFTIENTYSSIILRVPQTCANTACPLHCICVVISVELASVTVFQGRRYWGGSSLMPGPIAGRKGLAITLG